MEGSEGEKVFSSHGLNPRMFVNDVLNAVDDVVDGAFDAFLQRARELVGVSTSDASEGDRSEELVRGISLLHDNVQLVLDKRLSTWENYSLQHCFAVPEGFSSNMMDASCDISNILDSDSDKDLDDQLQSLRNKISNAGKEHTELQEEILALKKQFALVHHWNSYVEEAIKLSQNNSVYDVVQEIAKLAPALLEKRDDLMLKEKHDILATSGDICSNYTHLYDDSLGLCVNLQDLQQIIHRLDNK